MRQGAIWAVWGFLISFNFIWVHYLLILFVSFSYLWVPNGRNVTFLFIYFYLFFCFYFLLFVVFAIFEIYDFQTFVAITRCPLTVGAAISGSDHHHCRPLHRYNSYLLTSIWLLICIFFGCLLFASLLFGCLSFSIFMVNIGYFLFTETAAWFTTITLQP